MRITRQMALDSGCCVERVDELIAEHGWHPGRGVSPRTLLKVATDSDREFILRAILYGLPHRLQVEFACVCAESVLHLAGAARPACEAALVAARRCAAAPTEENRALARQAADAAWAAWAAWAAAAAARAARAARAAVAAARAARAAAAAAEAARAAGAWAAEAAARAAAAWAAWAEAAAWAEEEQDKRLLALCAQADREKAEVAPV